jgi:hypothetical protein
MNPVISRGASGRPLAKPARTFPQKKPRLLAQVTEVFRVRNETPWWLRDARRGCGTQEYSWIDLFLRDGFRCVYCGFDLSASALTIATATHDHVVPQCLFIPESEANRGVNLVACCASCNSLKGNWYPLAPDDPAWRSRADFIDASRRYIEKAASQLHLRYQRFVGNAARLAPLESWSAHRRTDIAKDREAYSKSAYADLRPRQT